MSHVPLLWRWLQEFPEANFDDSGPKTLEEMTANYWSRLDHGHIIRQVSVNGDPVGAVGVARLPWGTLFMGVCFTQSVHGSGIPELAVFQILEEEFRHSESVWAEFFAANVRVARFLAKFGAVEQPCEKKSTRAGKPIDWKRVLITRAAFREHTGQGSDSAGDLRSSNLWGAP